MALLTAALVSLGVIFLGFLLSSLPLYFSVKLLNGKTSLLKTIFVTFLSGIIVSAISFKFKVFGGLIAFFILIWIYHETFRLRWLKAILAWILQFFFIGLFYAIAFIVLVALLGISLAGM